MNPYLFIVGCPRSGTTLLRRMVDAHPLVAIPREQHWLPKWFERRRGLTPERLVTPKLVSDLLGYEKFSRMHIGREELERLVMRDAPVEYPEFVTGVFDLYGKVRGTSLVGDKTPAYVRSIPTLHNLWPEAKFVHLIRDGRDVCLSVLNWERATKLAGRFTTWGEDPVTSSALWWEWHVRMGHEDGGSLGSELYREVRYESLIGDPVEECERLCRFLDLPYDDAMLRFHEGRERTDPKLDAKKAWRPVTSGLRNWRTQMTEADIERFEAAAGNLLEELGYERVVSNPEAEALEHAARIRHAFIHDVRAQENRTPEAWEE